MDSQLKSFIDRTIRSYATYHCGVYSMDIDDLVRADCIAFIDRLLEYDTLTDEMLRDRMQELINERLSWVETEDNYARGLRPIHDSTTGEVSWIGDAK
jgi:hypothetical protein